MSDNLSVALEIVGVIALMVILSFFVTELLRPDPHDRARRFSLTNFQKLQDSLTTVLEDPDISEAEKKRIQETITKVKEARELFEKRGEDHHEGDGQKS